MGGAGRDSRRGQGGASVGIPEPEYFNYKRHGFGAARPAAVSGRNQGVDMPVETGGHLSREPR